MLLNVGQVSLRVATMMDDPSQSWCDQPYVLPFLNLAWDDLSVDFAQLGMGYEEVVTILDTVAAGTLDLSGFQADGQLLDAMILPVLLEWKREGADDSTYREIPRKDRVPDVIAGGAPTFLGYEWRGGVIYLSNCDIPTTLRVRFKAYSLDFTDPVQGMVTGATNILAYKVVEQLCAPMIRNNIEGLKWAAAKGLEAKENFQALVIKQKQGMVIRLGSMSGRGRRRNRFVIMAGQ